MKRTIEKHFLFNRNEAQDLQKKAKKACLTEAALVRFLIKGYEPRERPSDNFYDAMNEIEREAERQRDGLECVMLEAILRKDTELEVK